VPGEVVEVIHVSLDAPSVAVLGLSTVSSSFKVGGGSSDNDGGDESNFVEHFMFILKFELYLKIKNSSFNTFKPIKSENFFN
jgi:hypothetical protein